MKNKIHNIFFIVAVICMLLFLLFTILDYIKYKNMLTSAPFYVFVLVRIVYFIIPAVICIIIGLVIKHKQRK